MKKVDSRELRAIQKKAIKDVKRQKKTKSPRSSTLMSCDEGVVMLMHNQLDNMLKIDAFVYLGLEKRRNNRSPPIRRMNQKLR